METENEGTCKFASNAMWQVLENAEPTSVSCVHLELSSQVTHIEGYQENSICALLGLE